MNESKPQSVLNIPTAIIIAGAIVAGAIIYTMKPSGPTERPLLGVTSNEVKEVTSKDHILGNPNAKIKIVEYSDPSCPFCKMFHNTMRQVMDTYGKSGDVAWVYRHFPLDKPGTRPDGSALHPNAGHEAQALECAGALGGNDKFWAYTNRLYDVTPSVTNTSPDGLDQKQLYVIAKYVGLDDAAFRDCLDSGRFKDKVESDYTDGYNAGITGTPSSFILMQGKKQVPIEGAQPFDVLKSTIDSILADKS
jgi:protein-disulfide isomerase